MGKYLAWGHDIKTRGSEVLVWWVKCFPVWPNQTQLMSIYQISTKCWKFQNFYFSLKTVKTCIKEQVHLRTFRLKFVQKSTKYTRTHSAWKVEDWKEGSWGSWCILNLLFFLLFSFNFVRQSCVSARLARFFWTCLSQPYIHQLSPWFSMRLCTNGPHTSCDNYAHL